MRIGANTYPYLYSCTLTESFESLAKLGFRYIEILSSPPILRPKELTLEAKQRIKRTAKELGIQLTALNPPGLDINLASVNPEMRAFTVDQYKQLIKLAKEWEIPFIVMPPGKLHPLLPPDFEWVWSHCKRSFQELVEFAEVCGVTLLIENIPSLFLQKSEEIAWVLNEIKSPCLATIYDVANGFMVEDPADGIRLLADRIRLVHLSDTKRSKWEHSVIGNGEVDFAGVYAALQDINYKGICMLEIISRDAQSGFTESLRKLKHNGWDVDA